MKDWRVVLELADEIGVTTAARQYWDQREYPVWLVWMANKASGEVGAEIDGRSEAELTAELQARQDAEILQETLGFFAKGRKK